MKVNSVHPMKRAGFREGEHTADWELYVWAPDLAALFEQAALGMYQLAGTVLAGEPKVFRSFELTAEDDESLLVAFLSELLYLSEQDHLGFDDYEITIQGTRLNVRLGGGRLLKQEKEIKAVTYHHLDIKHSAQRCEVTIVFDV